MLKEFIFCFGAVYFFSFIFNAPPRTRVVAGLIGAVCYGLFLSLKNAGIALLACYFIATVVMAFFCEIFAVVLKTPSTTFVSTAIMGLVPGIGLYRTMSMLTFGDYQKGAQIGIETLMSIGSIAMALATSLLIIKLVYFIRSAIQTKTAKEKE